jgi:hypothetical protein
MIHLMSEQADSPQAPRTRGPGYPAIDLGIAIERAVQLGKVSDRHPVPLEAAAEAWGYTPRSSNNPVTAAALKRFGLVDDVGEGSARQLRLTDFGREVVFLSEDRSNPRWGDVIKRAALEPRIHQEVIGHFGGALPDDRVVLHYLMFDLGFARASAQDFAKRLRSTLDFAGIKGATDVGSDSRRSEPPIADAAPVRSIPQDVRTYGGDLEGHPLFSRVPAELPRETARAIQIPYSVGEWATLQAPFPLTDNEWRSMMAVLEAMKPGLVAEPATGAPADAPDVAVDAGQREEA